MKKFLLDAIVKPFVAILFFTAFGGGFVFFGFQSVDLTGHKEPGGTASFDLERKHLLGLVTFREHIDGVREAGMTTSRSSSSGRSQTLSNAVLISDTRSLPIFTGSSNLDDGAKQEIIRKVNTFLQDQNGREFKDSAHIYNLFGWVGLPFFLIAIWGILGWPYHIYSSLKKISSRPDLSR